MCQPDLPSVTRYSTTLTGCSCPDWQYRKHRRPCKHQRCLMDAAGVVEEWQAHNGRELMPKWTAEIKD